MARKEIKAKKVTLNADEIFDQTGAHQHQQIDSICPQCAMLRTVVHAIKFNDVNEAYSVVIRTWEPTRASGRLVPHH